MVVSKRLRNYILVVVLLVFLAVEAPIIAAGRLTAPQPADVMIVPGAKIIGREPSAILRLRLDTAAELHRRQYAPVIIVSGARGRDEEIAEAAAMRDYLIKKGIPGECILLEDASYNTYQNLANSRAIMARHGYRKALIVSSASHIRRALVLASYLSIEACGAPAPLPDSAYLAAKQYLREGAAMMALVFTGR